MGVELVTDEQYCKKALGDAYAVPLERTAGRAAGCAVSFAWVRALHIPVHGRLQRCGHPTRFLFIFFFSAARVSPARYFWRALRFHDAPVDLQHEFSLAFLAALQECGAA